MLKTYSGEINAFEFHCGRLIVIGTARRDYPAAGLSLILPHFDADVPFWYAFGMHFMLWRDRYTVLIGWDFTRREMQNGKPVF
mgnify:CR=1 FL=1